MTAGSVAALSVPGEGKQFREAVIERTATPADVKIWNRGAGALKDYRAMNAQDCGSHRFQNASANLNGGIRQPDMMVKISHKNNMLYDYLA